MTVTCPVAAPAGIMKLMLLAVKLTTGAPMLPPPCWLNVTCGVAGPPPVKLLPLKEICVPMGPELGLNELIAGGGALDKVMFSLVDDVLPATSVACAVIVLVPEVRVSEQLNDPL